MNTLNKWLTLGANFGVIAGLIFLAFQVKQNTLQMRTGTSFSIMQSLNEINLSFYSDSALVDLVNRGEKDFQSLNALERSQFSSFQFSRINLAIHVYRTEEEGISDVLFPYIDFLIQEFHRKPGLQEFLKSIEKEWVGSKELYNMLRVKDLN